MNETVLITGASSGIGLELAKVFASHQYNLVLVARTKDKMLLLKNELEHDYGISVQVLMKDLSLPNSPDEIFAELQQAAIEIGILVNNAGFGSFGPFVDSDIQNQLEMIQLNITGLTQLTKLALPRMVANRKGKILNVASTAAFQPGPLMAVYYATKAYVLSFSEALANELQDQGITVTALCPGPTRTGFEQRANLEQSKLFQKSVMDAHRVAKLGYRGLMSNKKVVIPGFKNRVLASSVRFTPRNIVTKFVRSMQNKK